VDALKSVGCRTGCPNADATQDALKSVGCRTECPNADATQDALKSVGKNLSGEFCRTLQARTSDYFTHFTGQTLEVPARAAD